MGRELIRVIIYLQQEDKIMKSKMQPPTSSRELRSAGHETENMRLAPASCGSFVDKGALAPLEDPEKAREILSKLIAYHAQHDGSAELYQLLHNDLGLSNPEIEAMGFSLAHRYETISDDAYRDIVDYICFEQETSIIWPWAITGDAMLACAQDLHEIASQLAATGSWDTESIYECLTKTFGNNPALEQGGQSEMKL